MRKAIFVFAVVMTLCACGRMRVKHDHSRQMLQMRMPEDTVHVEPVVEEEDTAIWDDEPMTVLPQEPEHGKAPANVDEEMERMMRGEDVTFEP
ncbi:MAG: hypothetical protein IJV38_02275 [Prevotella sp.]|nr:hypothetical protein [Prevotella sp.]MBQ9654830.1 hypothetical protein [Prevotella sp.]